MSDLVPYIPGGDELAAIQKLGAAMAESGFFKDSRGAAQMVVKILAGKEYGLSPVQAATGLHIVEGKITLSANTQAALIKRHPKYDYRVLTMTDEACEIEFYEEGEAIGRSSFTKADAQKAGLWGRQTWAKYPRNMLFARALSNGATWYCGDVFNGPVYDPDELAADEVVEPAKPRRSRRTPSDTDAGAGNTPEAGGDGHPPSAGTDSAPDLAAGADTGDSAPGQSEAGESEGSPAAETVDLTTGEVIEAPLESADGSLSMKTANEILAWRDELRKLDDSVSWDGRITEFCRKRGWNEAALTEENGQEIIVALKGRAIQLGFDAQPEVE